MVVLRLPIRLLLSLMLTTLAGCSPASPDRARESETRAPLTGIAGQIVDVTNAERARAGLTAYRTNAQLGEAARIQAEQVAAAGRIEHVIPEARYPTLENRLDAAGYRWRAAGENLAFGQRDTATLVNGWMQSPGHRANILHTTFTEVGVAHLVDASGRPYYVQVFGRPAP